MSQEQSFKVYRIDSNVFAYPGYAVCTVFRNPGGKLKAESFVLLQASDTEVSSTACKILFPSNDPSFPISIDESFAADEALRQAEVDASILVHERNKSSSSPIHWPKNQLVEVPQHRLVGVWAYTPLKNQLSRVGDSTGCDLLSKYINSLRSLPEVTRSPLSL